MLVVVVIVMYTNLSVTVIATRKNKMYNLTQKGRYFIITPRPEKKLEDALFKSLSYEKKGREYMPNPQWGIVRLYSIKKCKFPIGLLNKVKKIFIKLKLDFRVQRVKLHFKVVMSQCVNLRPYQLEAARALMINNGGILSMPCGSGKTRVAIAFIKTLNVKTLVVVPTTYLRDQWIGQVPENVMVKTYQSLKSKAFLRQFDLVIFDECHIVAAKTLQLVGLNLNEQAIVVGLSATPFMRDDDNMKVQSVLGDIVFEISLRELIDQKFLVDADIIVHKLEKVENVFNDYPMMYNEGIAYNSERNAIIADIVHRSKENILILVDRIDHGQHLYDGLQSEEVDCVFLHGKSKDKHDINHDVIIATSIFDIGIDVPRWSTLILAGGGKSTIKVVQRLGRVLRLFEGKGKAQIHDFKDSCRWLKDHFQERYNIYSKEFEVKYAD